MSDVKITPDTDKVRILLSKLHELSVRGDEHEKSVASHKLSQILKRYGINDFNGDKKVKRVFKIEDDKDCLMMLSQCIWSVCGDERIDYKGKKAFVSMSSENYIEVSEKFKCFWDEYCKGKAQYFKAFIIKNELVAKSDDNNIDKDEAKNIGRMMTVIDKGSVPKKMVK